MTISINWPATGQPMGFGCHMQVHEDAAITSGDIIVASLYWTNGAGEFTGLVGGSGALSAGSHNAEVTLGLSVQGAGGLASAPNRIGGQLLGGLVGVHLVYQHGLTPVEELFLDDYYVHDPISQLGYLAVNLLEGYLADLGIGHDPMLDTILASVRTTYG